MMVLDRTTIVMVAVAALVAMQGIEAEAGCPFGHSTESATEAVGTPVLGQIPAATNQSDPLMVVNVDLFQPMYSDAGKALLADFILTTEGDYLVLLQSAGNGSSYSRVDSIPFTPPLYHYLKSVSHFPLFSLMLTARFTGSSASEPIPLLPPARQALQQLHQGISRALPTLQQPWRFPTAAQRQRQQWIANQVLQWASATLASGELSLQQAMALANSTTAAAMTNANEAVMAQLQGLLNATRTIEERYGLDLRNHSASPRVAVLTSHMASDRNSISQFFARYLNSTASPDFSLEYVTLTGIQVEESITSLLATHRTDYLTGQAFFGNPFRMHEDLLCHGAYLALNQLLPGAPRAPGCMDPLPQPQQ